MKLFLIILAKIFNALPKTDKVLLHWCHIYGKYGLEAPNLVGMTSAPTVSTDATPSSITTTSAVFDTNSITNTGGENASARGICWVAGAGGTPTTANSKTTESGSFSTGNFSATATGLSENSTYSVRAYATNSAGTGYGATVEVTTIADPPTVTLSSPADTSSTTDTTPDLTFTGTDSQSDDIRYEVQVDTVNTFNSVGGTLPQIFAISGTDAGFTGSPDNTDPYTSGQAVTYTVQSALSAGTYYWRVRGKDPSGSNIYGSWSSTRSFDVTAAGTTLTPGNASLTLTAQTPTVAVSSNYSGTPGVASLTTTLYTPTVSVSGVFTDWHSFPFSDSWLADDLSGTPVSSWTNGQGGTALTQATGDNQPAYSATSGPNSQPGVTFDGTNDSLQAAIGTKSQPQSYVIIFRNITNGSFEWIFDSMSASDRNLLGQNSSAAWELYAGTVQVAGTTDTTAHAALAYYNGASSVLELDNTNIISANPGTQSLGTGITVGARYDGLTTGVANVVISAIGVYSGDARTDGSWQDLVDYAYNKWGLELDTPTAGTTLTPGNATLTLTAQTPTVALSDNKSITLATPTALTTSLWTPTVTATDNIAITLDVASLTLTTQTPTATVTNDQNATPGTASLTLTAQSPSASLSDNKDAVPGTASLTLTAQTPTVALSDNKTATPDIATLTLSPQTPLVKLDNRATPGVLNLTTALQTPTADLSDNKYATPDTASLSITAQTPTLDLSDNKSVTPGTASLTITGQQPSVLSGDNKEAIPGIATLTLTAQTPTVSLSDNKTATPDTTSLTLSPQTPSTTLNQILTPGVASLSLTAYEPTVVVDSGSIELTPGVAEMVTAIFAPDVTISANQTITPGTATLSLSTTAPIINGEINYRKLWYDTDGNTYRVVNQSAGIIVKV